MNKIIEITRSWARVLNPTQEQQQEADRRLLICEGCPAIREIEMKDLSGGLVDNYFVCGKCGCPLRGKVFTPNINGCPDNKW